MNRTTIFEDWQRYFNKRNLLEEQLLLEGRKENAMRALIRKISDEFTIKHMENSVFPAILDRDPTENKKYIEWMARIINKKVLRVLSMPWELPGDEPNRRAEMTNAATTAVNTISRNLRDYHKLSQRNLIEKNIDSFKDLGDWENKIYNAKRELEEREKLEKLKDEAKGKTFFLDEDDDYRLVRPDSEGSACFWGQGATWCISATRSQNYYKEYNSKGVGFYFILFKHLPQGHSNKHLALAYKKGDDWNEPSEGIWDVPDDKHGEEIVYEAFKENYIAKYSKKIRVKLAKEAFIEKYGNRQLSDREKSDAKSSIELEVFNNILEEFDNIDSYDYEDLEETTRTIMKNFGFEADIDDEDQWEEWIDEFNELANEDASNAMMQSAQHINKEPPGPDASDFEEVLMEYSLNHFDVSYEEIDAGYWFFTAKASWDLEEDVEFIDPSGVDEDEVQEIIDSKVSNHDPGYERQEEIYNLQYNVTYEDTWSSDYQAGDPIDAFRDFVGEISYNIDSAWTDIKEEVTEELKESGLTVGGTLSALYDRFTGLNLEHFEAEIEDKLLSIYKTFEIIIPVPQHLWKHAPRGAAWQHRIHATESEVFQKYYNAVLERQNEQQNRFIDNLTNDFNYILKMYTAQAQAELPGFETDSKKTDVRGMGLEVPIANVSVYPRRGKPTLGASGIIVDYIFDIRIEVEDEESEETMVVIEKFVQRLDSDAMIKKLQDRFQNTLEDDVVKNVMPNFKEEEQQQVAENKKRKLKILIKEFQGRGGITSGGFGGMSPGLAGMMGANRGTSMDSHPADSGELPDDDSPHVAKAVLIRNSHVLLLKSKDGRWDLPGGHLKRGEGSVPALSRETFEETGLSINTSQLKQINGSTGTTRFYMGTYPHDDIVLSDEHVGHEFVSLQSIPGLEGLDNTYKQMIMKYDNINESKNRKNLRLVLS